VYRTAWIGWNKLAPAASDRINSRKKDRCFTVTATDGANVVKLKFHGTNLGARILARTSRGCYAETGPVEFQLKRSRAVTEIPRNTPFQFPAQTICRTPFQFEHLRWNIISTWSSVRYSQSNYKSHFVVYRSQKFQLNPFSLDRVADISSAA